MTYMAIIRRQTFARSPGGQELHVEQISFGPETCGHAHDSVQDADRCISQLANAVGLNLYDACVVIRTDREELKPVERQMLWNLYEANRKVVSRG